MCVRASMMMTQAKKGNEHTLLLLLLLLHTTHARASANECDVRLCAYERLCVYV